MSTSGEEVQTLWGIQVQPTQAKKTTSPTQQATPCRFYHRWKNALQHGVFICMDCGIHGYCPGCTNVVPWEVRLMGVIRRCTQHQSRGEI